MFKKLLLLPLLFCFVSSFSQRFGGFSPEKEWLQLKTEQYRIIFSKENQLQALKTASILEQMDTIAPNAGTKRKKVDIVFQNATTQANGYVGLAPFMSEYFLSPPSSSFLVGSLHWPSLLAIHENQHVLQLSNSYYGASKIASWLGGDLLFGALQRLSVPNWFMEGDAVRAETEYSKQGRGRLPFFMNGYRAYAAHNAFPKYASARNGSINTFVPNHYRLGYLMNSYGREKYGETFWPSVLKEAAAYRGILYPFSKAIKRKTGLNVTQFYRLATVWYRDEIVQSIKLDTVAPIFKQQKNAIVSYEYPQAFKDSSVLYFKQSFDEIGAIYSLVNQQEEKLFTPGLRTSNYFNYSNDKIVYAANYFDKRWSWTDYSDLSIYDLKTKKEKRLTFKQKLFSPSFSSSGQEIVALEVSPQHRFQLVIVNTTTGQIKQRISNPNNYYHSFPKFYSDSLLICSSRDSIGQMALTTVNRTTGEVQNLTQWSYHLVGTPNLSNNKVVFSASFDQVDNVYSYDLQKQSLHQITFNGLGRYHPLLLAESQQLYYLDFSLQGHTLKRVSTQALNPPKLLSKPTSLNELPSNQLQFLQGTQAINLEASIPDTFLISKYSKHSNLVNLHSWALNLGSPNFGIQLNSRNVLNTLDLSAGYNYNINEEAGNVSINASYAQYFPVLNAAILREGRSTLIKNGTRIRWYELESRLGLNIPLNLSSRKSTRNLSFGTGYAYDRIDFNSDRFIDTKVHATRTSYRYVQKRLKARKNIFTHLGIYSSYLREEAINRAGLSQQLFQNSFATRGIFQNHNLVIDADLVEKKGRNYYAFNDNFVYPRGFNTIAMDQLYKVGVNYHFPLIYPDEGAKGIFYLLRLRSNLFFDYAQDDKNGAKANHYASLGAELIFDFTFLNSFSSSIGVRYTGILNGGRFEEENNWELFIPLRRF